MIPRLFESNETKFTGLGIGEMAEATSCKVTEERNGSYELELVYPESGLLFKEIHAGMYILAKPNDTSQDQPFRIYKISEPMSSVITINAEHISYELSAIPVRPFTASSIAETLTKIKSNSMVANRFAFWTDSSRTGSLKVEKPKSARAILGGSEGSILDTFSGSRAPEFEFDRFSVKIHENRGTDKGVVIEYGKNLTDLKQEVSIDGVYSGVLAFWRKSASEDESGQSVIGDIQYAENHEAFPQERIYILDCSGDYQEAPLKSDLNNAAKAYLDSNKLSEPSVNMTISFVALWQTEEYVNIAPLERVSLCDTVHVNFPKPNIAATTKVIKTIYNTLLERYDSIELGDAKSSFADTIKQSIVSKTDETISTKMSEMEKAISHATSMITGGLGGYLYITRDADGKPTELCILDTDSIDTAVNVWRFNKGGLGHSSHGYSGPYDDVALTADGQINANAITTGKITSADIEGVNITGTTISGSSFSSKSDDGDYALRIREGMIESIKGEGTNQYARIWLDNDVPEDPGLDNGTFCEVYLGAGSSDGSSSIEIYDTYIVLNTRTIYIKNTAAYTGTINGAKYINGICVGKG